MEIEITFLVSEDCGRFSASRAELGENAGGITWQNSMNECQRIIMTPQQILEARDYIRSFGAWESEEIDNFSDSAVKSLLLQVAAGDILQAESLCWDYRTAEIDWAAYAAESAAGNVSGSLYMRSGKVFIGFCG
jgi:hypothetical protein